MASEDAEKKQHLTGNIVALTGLIGAIATITPVFESLTRLADASQQTIEAWRNLGIWIGLPLGIVVFGFGLYIRFTRYSQLMMIDALRIDPDNPAHLIGRADKISKLEELCRNSFLVNLVGESGAGKSALVRSGLVPLLKENEKLLPVYMDTWGQNWELGPATGLADAVWTALDDESRQKLELTGRPEATQLVGVLGRLESELSRTPLLIFDQFDDYQARHRDRFLVEDSQTVLPTSQLLQENPFWAGINELLKDRCVRCLFVTRADTAAGLESVRFIAPQIFPLERPQINIVEELLAKLTAITQDENGNSVEVIRDPEYGWLRLMSRVERDLDEDGQVLPVRLRLVLQGLTQLKKLTVSEYEKAGGCIGLEAGFIETKIRNAARNAGATGVTENQVRELLMSLVDREKLKTVGKPASELKVG